MCGNFVWNLDSLCAFKSGTLMRNLAEPGARFRAAAPNHPEALLEEPQAFQVVGEKNTIDIPVFEVMVYFPLIYCFTFQFGKDSSTLLYLRYVYFLHRLVQNFLVCT